MVDVINSILHELDYETIAQTELQFEEKSYYLKINRNRNIRCQVYIILQMLESQLPQSEKIKEFIIAISNYFQNVEDYISEMDRNTSLLLIVERDIPSILTDKVKIEVEDDPYYFKKYVLTYEKTELLQLKKAYEEVGQTPNEFIHSYIFNKGKFNVFKKNTQDEHIYRIVSEIAIKLPAIEIGTNEEDEIKTIEQYMRETPKFNEDELERVDNIVALLCNTAEVDEQLVNSILREWRYEEIGDKDVEQSNDKENLLG